MVFQKKKILPFLFFTKFVNIFPLPIYKKIVVPILSIILFPLTPFFLARKVTMEHLKYGVLISLRGIHFGVPVEIEKFEIETPKSILSSPKMSKSFLIPAKKQVNSLLT